MKRIIAFVLSMMILPVMVKADDRPIDYQQLPTNAKTFIKAEFPNEAAVRVTKDIELSGDTYDVVFASGIKLEFNHSGEWTEISRKHGQIDSKFVPKQIQGIVKGRWPEAGYTKIERNRQSYEVELTNGLELKFDKRFRLIDIDD